ncbi:hypothetical protein T265_01611 [Opisthorchis viverrini]|uniref:Sodium / potassium ATPase beta chain n=1 Tax=Opisthorchis viverrini TaxID=6198 RepID=A0A074ZY57_OPIVI|nr:hypothetical protein T265_01611 [Opisthorchis viverrini]KER32388.1 hypothetical protein T265_01611 [Opisthorchis viverrini]
MEEAQKAGNARRLFQWIRANSPRKPPVSETIKHKNGTTISNKEERLDRWAEYFEQQLSWPPADAHLQVEPWTVNVKPPTALEVYDCICSLKRHRAPGPDELPPALFKDGGEVLSQRLFDLFACVWVKECVPDNWGESVIVPVFEKGARKANSVYTIFLWLTPWKVKNGYPETYATYLNALVAFVYPYDIRVHVQDTNYECIPSGGNASIQQNRRPDLMTSACFFDLKWSYRCNVNRQFGYDDSSPCVILTLNRIYGWLPSSSDGVQVCCQGASPNDDDLLGTLCFYDALIHDEGGCARRCGTFPHQYYPYLNQNSYQSPLVFLEIRNPRKNVLIRIQCEINNTPNRSPVTFELLID